ncbi:putative glycosidase CRH2 [Dimargaris verticillata]|uniref:Glycosidase CRH2 n=1 Tax=Dimargaris verticillata TaxID=2761393 RepID=A0A9W8EDE1_9FUNG|nr:putative glycosidase CRH2 [Dimargaris verticillata]
MQLVSLLLVLSPLVPWANAICEHYGDTCPEQVPCCNSAGYCSNVAASCRVGCQAENSFSKDSCQPEPECLDMTDNFDANSLAPAANFSGNPKKSAWTSDFEPNRAEVKSSNLRLYMKKDSSQFNGSKGFGATVSSVRFMDYGYAGAHVKTASTSKGVVSSFIIKNEEGDEIDFEWVGKDPTKVQTNYYWDGYVDLNNYGSMEEFDVGGDTSQDFHFYELYWEPNEIRWLIDGKTVRTLSKKDTYSEIKKTFMYPYRPSRVQFSIWDGGNDEKQGTRDWAGTPTDWSSPDTTYEMLVQEVKMTCFYKSNNTDPKDWPWDDMEKMTGSNAPPTGQPNSNGTSGSPGSGTHVAPLIPESEATQSDNAATLFASGVSTLGLVAMGLATALWQAC